MSRVARSKRREEYIPAVDHTCRTSQEIIVGTLRTFCAEGIVEIRCLGVDGRKKRTDSGYYDPDHFEQAAADVARYISDGRTSGVYFTINPPIPVLLSRAANRIEEWSDTTTSDTDVVHRAWLLVDCDPKRPSGISSTDDELRAAQQRAADITEWMMQQGMCEPIVAMSGNGAHLQFPIRLPNDSESTALVKRVLEVIDQEFTDAAVGVDLTVFNAARICRLYGTFSRKGDDTPERPHRMSRLIHVPDYIESRTGEFCDADTLRRIADQFIEIPAKSPAGNGVAVSGHSRLVMDTYLADHGIAYKLTDGCKGFRKYMVECPFNGSHVRSYVFQHESGAVGFKCSHNSCSGNRWEQFKAVYPVDRQRHYDPPLPIQDDRPANLNGNVQSRRQESVQRVSDVHANSPADGKTCRVVLHSVWNEIEKPVPMREVVIDGLLRRGEVANIVAATKIGKSWLAAGLAFSVAIGRTWLGRSTLKGNVLMIDNELHPETISNRMAAVARAMGVSSDDERADFHYISLRGEAVGIGDIQGMLSDYKPGDLNLVVLDAKYRFFTGEENSNDAQTLFHNAVDRLARQLDCVIVLIHHSSKGDQTGKSVVDVGSGGGSQARAADVHLIIRPHNDEGFAVLDAAVRTFAPVEPQTLQWEFPLWHLAQAVEPVLRAEKSRGDSKQEARDAEALSEMTRLMHSKKGEPVTRHWIRTQMGWQLDRVNRIVRIGIDAGRIVLNGTRTTRNGKEVDLLTLGSYVDQQDDESEHMVNGSF